jgi:altronate dehydratase small subunit
MIPVEPVIVISETDNVATALDALEAGRVIHHRGTPITVVETIPRGHKLALTRVTAGDAVIKYGNSIGVARVDIPAGAHVHTHNVSSERGRGDLSSTLLKDGRIAEPDDVRRTDG